MIQHSTDMHMANKRRIWEKVKQKKRKTTQQTNEQTNERIIFALKGQVQIV